MKRLDDMLARMPELEEKARQRAERERSSGVPELSNVVQLPLWPEPVRAVPNGFLRSSLFGAIRKGRRRYMDREMVAAVDTVEIQYTGQRLDQGDLDVYESVLHALRVHAMGKECRITSYELLKIMGKKDTGGNRATLHDRIVRLRANAVEIKQGRCRYIGGLLDEAFKDEETQQWVVVLNPKLRVLFARDQFTQIEWSVRHELEGHQLAQWLHGFYASHAKPYPVKVETLHKLCGSETERMDHFREKLRKALDAVTEASKTHGEGFRYGIRGDLVHVEKRPSEPQRRHLSKLKKPGT